MSAATMIDSQSVVKNKSAGDTLSANDLEEGVAVIMPLEVAERGLRKEDVSKPGVIPMIARNVVDIELLMRNKVQLSAFLRRTCDGSYEKRCDVVQQVLEHGIKKQGARGSRAR